MTQGCFQDLTDQQWWPPGHPAPDALSEAAGGSTPLGRPREQPPHMSEDAHTLVQAELMCKLFLRVLLTENSFGFFAGNG